MVEYRIITRLSIPDVGLVRALYSKQFSQLRPIEFVLAMIP